MHSLHDYVLVNRPCIHSIAPLLWLQFIAHMMLFHGLNVLYFYVSTVRSMCTVSNLTDCLWCLHFMLFRYVALVQCE